MPAFSRPFDPVNIGREPDVAITLPDPSRAAGDLLIRPGIARYASAELVLMHVRPAGARFNFFAPVKGPGRNISLDVPMAEGVNQLLEISLLPFSITPVLRALRPGLPTFYLGYSRADNSPEDDQLVDPTVALASVTGDAFIGALFEDRVAIAPWTWIDLIGGAMETTRDSAGADEWNRLASLYTYTRAVRVLDHAGKAAPTRSFEVRIRRADGTFEGPWRRTTGLDSDLERAVVADPLPRAAGDQASLFGDPGERTEITWGGAAPAGDTTLPVHSIYETGDSTVPGAALLLPADLQRVHVQLLELASWFAPRTSGTSADLARYRTKSRVEPLVDGIPFFKRLVDDMVLLTQPGARSDHGIHFAGWAFKDFSLDADRTDSGGTSVDTSLPALTDSIIANGAGARFLVFKFLDFKSDPDSDAQRAALIVLVALTDALVLFSVLGAVGTSATGYVIVLGGQILGAALLPELFSASAILEAIVEKSKDIVPILNHASEIALWVPHTVRLADNPVAVTPLPLDLDTYLDKFGSWHQKIQLIKRPGDSGDEFVAYLGGIDINSDRLDTPGHQILSPFHDVQARITGPGAADVFLSWHERYEFHRTATSLDPVFPPPSAATLPEQEAAHIVQIGRTYYKPAGVSPLPFAPNGDTTTNDTLIRALTAAREYIYIEDQYFTPNTSDPPGSATTYFDALMGAASTCRRLVILVPAETDQPFGDTRRRYLFNRLRLAWGDRVLIGAPVRRPLLPTTGRVTCEGRCRLLQAMATGDSLVILGPPAHVPETGPFWLWIDGELMLSTGQPRDTTLGGAAAKEMDVLRGASGTDPRWGARERNHRAGAAITLAQLKGIYVHAKIMMVDDVFLSIGSANINRRALFHDGEINIFAVPEKLRAAPDNPARALRAALWAEHFGLPPRMGGVMFNDPIAAFELFRRSRYEGNRFTPFSALDLKPYLSIPLGDGLVINALAATVIRWAESLVPLVWNDLSDPTCFTDPDPTAGPTP